MYQRGNVRAGKLLRKGRAGRVPRRVEARAVVSADHIDRYITRELHKMEGFDAVRVSVGYRLRGVDENGCNWSGDVVPRYGSGAPPADVVTAALRPISRAAQARFNLSE